MKRLPLIALSMLSFLLMPTWSPYAHAEKLKPFVLGNTPPGDMVTVVATVSANLQAQGFTLIGTYTPYPGATVICATIDDLLAAAASATNGGFGAAQRVAVTKVDSNLQVSYMNPAYLGAAYGLGTLETISAKLAAALGHEAEFGAQGVEKKKLAPGKYHYKMFMPYFNDVDVLNTFPDYQTGIETVEKNLAAGLGGTGKVYRIDLPGTEVSVFGVAIPIGDGVDSGAKDTDGEVMAIIDYEQYKSTAYLPYELMVQGNQAIALRGRYRIAVHFPDTPMTGEHGFTKIMSSPKGIKKALKAAAGN